MITRVGEVARVSPGLVTSGRGAGAKAGSWRISVVSGANIQDDSLDLESAEMILVEQNASTEKHILQPHDVVVTARSTVVKAALVPASVSRTVANANLLVVRPNVPEAGLYLWWFFTSAYGRQLLESSMVPGATLMSLPASTLLDLEVPWPADAELFRLADLIEVSEQAYTAAREATAIRRNVIRDGVVNAIINKAS
jgi:hypothetical protein